MTAQEAKARSLIEKKSAINLLEAFAVAIKHYLRGEDGIYYQFVVLQVTHGMQFIIISPGTFTTSLNSFQPTLFQPDCLLPRRIYLLIIQRMEPDFLNRQQAHSVPQSAARSLQMA